ncbi:FtsX-like permease family protein [Streptomyces macrosporus]|uniref:FtsX-like permease family protein n=1 Tax=Streptomyces macrosporus TaxID=44032 RepID=A0ABP5WCU1_9ACTN
MPWIRARLRASAGGALAFGLLVMVTAFLATAVPRQVAVHENAALRQVFAGTTPDQRGVTVTAEIVPGAPGEPDTAVPSPEELRDAARALRDVARPPLTTDPDETVSGIRNGTPMEVSGRGLARPSGLSPRMSLVTRPPDADVRLVSGRMPAPDVRGNTVEAVVTTRTAEVVGLRVGSTVRFPDVTGTPVTVRVSGLVAPRDRGAAYWHTGPDLPEPGLRTVPGELPPPRYWHFSALIDSGARRVLPFCDGGAVVFWHHPVRTDVLAAEDVGALRRALVSLTTGPDAARVADRSPVAAPDIGADDLVALLGAFEEERRTARSLVLIASVGVGAAALVVLVMAGALAAAARRTELALLRARGAGLPGIGLRLLGETAAVAVPAVAAGTACALLWVPAPRDTVSLLPGAAVAVPACLTLPVLAMAAHRRPRPPARDDVAGARPSRRRVVVELTVLASALGGLVAARRHDTDDGADPLIAVVPVLLAVVVALVLLRVYPLPLRLLARPAARLKGPVAALALARAARAPAVSALSLPAVLVALTVAAFGGSVPAGVADARARAALVEVGADARVESSAALPAGLDARIRRVAGVSDTAAVRIEEGEGLIGVSSRLLTLITVEPRSYARLVARTGLDGGGPFPAEELGRARDGGPLPAVVSPHVAEALGDGTGFVDGGDGPARIRVVAVRDALPAASGEFVVVPAAAPRPTTLLVSGSGIDGDALAAEARRAGDGLTVTLRSRTEAEYGAGPLRDGTRRLHGAAVVAAAGYGALALLLSLSQSAPERRTTLARLRAMGMSRRQGGALVWAETLPPVLLGVLGGVGTALAAVPLLRPGVDPTPLAFTARAGGSGEGTVRAVLTHDVGALLWPAAAVTALACGIVAVQAWRGTRGEGNRLSTGERE